jgi:DHA1 family bicyclomycin/chloramphenicol resistance-like MFS transporter
MIRDRYEGAAMARIMSHAQSVFVIGPLAAPYIGGFLISNGPWQLSFGLLAVYGAALFLVALALLTETLPARDPSALSPARLVGNWAAVLRHPRSRRFVLVLVATGCAHMTYISTAASVYMDAYGLTPNQFAIAFSAAAVFTLSAYLLNGRLVRTQPLERLMTLGIACQVAATAANLGLVLAGAASIWSLALLIGLFYFGYGLSGANAATLAMAPHGRIAGAATAFIGMMQIVPTSIVGAIAAWFYRGTAVPMVTAMAFGAAAAAIALWNARRAI